MTLNSFYLSVRQKQSEKYGCLTAKTGHKNTEEFIKDLTAFVEENKGFVHRSQKKKRAKKK